MYPIYEYTIEGHPSIYDQQYMGVYADDSLLRTNNAKERKTETG